MSEQTKKRVTIDDILSFNPCASYTRERLQTLFGIKKYLTLKDLEQIDIPDADKLWLLLREDFIPARDLHLLACKFAERALRRERKAGREPDARSWVAIKAKRDWLNGEISDEQFAAAGAAAWAAAEAAAWEAAGVAAGEAAGVAAGEAERKYQLRIVIKKILTQE